MQRMQLVKAETTGAYNSYQHVINNLMCVVGLSFLSLISCRSVSTDSEPTLSALLAEEKKQQGNEAYLHSKTFTSGTKAYCVGFQDGTFPDMGWHIEGEMGGFWTHPIKVLDGFTAHVVVDGAVTALDTASTYAIAPTGNTFVYKRGDLTVTRSQFIPDGSRSMVVEFVIDGAPNGAELFFDPRVDLRPTWLGERTGMIDGSDSIAAGPNWKAQDVRNGWTAIIVAEENATYAKDRIRSRSSEVHRFFIASGRTAEEAEMELAAVKDWRISYDEKSRRHEKLGERSSFIASEDKEVETVFSWLKHNAIWLEMDADSLGYGFAAGMEDYPWFFGCDAEFSVLGLNAVGRYDLSKSMLRLLAKASERANGNGRIIHEMSTNGAVFNPGNLNETPQFVTAVWDTYRWSGDVDFLKEMYPLMVKSMRWLQEQDADGNGIPDGYGMMEIHGMNGEMIDVAAYAVQAWNALEKAALAMDNDASIAEWAGKNAARLSAYINQEYWVESADAYADVRGTPQQAIELIEDAIVRADGLDKPWAVEELKAVKKLALKHTLESMPNPDEIYWEPTLYPYSVHHNWIVNTPMEVGFAPKDRALRALDKAAQYTNPFGTFVTGIDRDQSAGTDTEGFAKRKKIFSYVGAVMTLPTGVSAVAENNYGRPDRALDYLKRMSKSWSYAHPGSMYEVSPDFGMMCQAWNIYSFAFPIVRQFFGVEPDPTARTIHIDPSFPTRWKQPQLNHIQIGEGSNATALDIAFIRGEAEKKNTLTIDQHAEELWSISLSVPQSAELEVDGKAQNLLQSSEESVEIIGKNIVLRW